MRAALSFAMLALFVLLGASGVAFAEVLDEEEDGRVDMVTAEKPHKRSDFRGDRLSWMDFVRDRMTLGQPEADQTEVAEASVNLALGALTNASLDPLAPKGAAPTAASGPAVPAAKPILPKFDPALDPMDPTADTSTGPAPDVMNGALAKPNLPKFDPALDPLETDSAAGPAPDAMNGALAKPNLPKFDPALDPMDPQADPFAGADRGLARSGAFVNPSVSGGASRSPQGNVDHTHEW